MNKERVLKEAQEIASSFSFWMVSGNISHLYGYVLETSSVKYELEIKFDENFPSSPPKLKFYDAIKDLLGQIKLSSLDNWTEVTKVVDILFELKEKIKSSLGMDQSTGKADELIEPFSEESPNKIEAHAVENNSFDTSQKAQVSSNKIDNQPSEDVEYITPDLNAYPPEFDASGYLTPTEDIVFQSEGQKKTRSEETDYNLTEILDTDHASVLLNTGKHSSCNRRDPRIRN
jgi:ubiquitin-protein ligase